MKDTELSSIVKEAEVIAQGNYASHEDTARNHAKLQSMIVKVNSELIKTIRQLDAKNSRLQKQVYILTIVATVCAIIALLK